MVLFSVSALNANKISEKINLKDYKSDYSIAEQYFKKVVEDTIETPTVIDYEPKSLVSQTNNITRVRDIDKDIEDFFTLMVLCVDRDENKYSLNLWGINKDFTITLSVDGNEMKYLIQKSERIKTIYFNEYPDELKIKKIENSQFDLDLLKIFSKENIKNYYIGS